MRFWSIFQVFISMPYMFCSSFIGWFIHSFLCHLPQLKILKSWQPLTRNGERGGSVVECRTLEREVRGSRPTAAVLCPWARHFTPRKYWLITQEAMAPSRYDWKIVDWDVKPQHNQLTRKSSHFHFIKILKTIWWMNIILGIMVQCDTKIFLIM